MKKNKFCEISLILICFVEALIMLVRVFYGTNLTDEAFYIADVYQMLHGNLPYAYSNYSIAEWFFVVPFLWIYEIFVPDIEGIMLYSRICFVLFWYVCIGLGYRYLRKDYSRSSSLLVTICMIPYMGGSGVFNFSYNTIPSALVYLSALIILDAVEHNLSKRKKRISLLVAGFLLGITVLTHPVYLFFVALLGALIMYRSSSRETRLENILYCVLGGISEVIVVFIPIAIQVGFSKLGEGIMSMLSPYPTKSLTESTALDRFSSVFLKIRYMVLFLVLIALVSYILELCCSKWNKREFKTEKAYFRGVSFSLLLLVISNGYLMISQGFSVWRYGLLGSLALLIILFGRAAKENGILLYLGADLLVFSLFQVSLPNYASYQRFIAAYPVLLLGLIVLSNKEDISTRVFSYISFLICAVSITICNFRFFCNDCDEMKMLSSKVDRGVYRGIYTTFDRARDLPEMEDYLNQVVSEGEKYAAFDLAPFAYLMVHDGTMADLTSWDSLNYSNKVNGPDNLYAYYVRRGIIPEKYIFIDFGRDENLSIEDPSILFNEYIGAYYQKTQDFCLNETFYHVVVFEKKEETEDIDFDDWIERHMYKEQ